jgi:DNA-binding CsgD family transcriptional regulator
VAQHLYRLWATQEAFEAHVVGHGCSELPSGDGGEQRPFVANASDPPGLTGKLAEIVRLWKKDVSRKEIAKQHNLSPKTISNLIEGARNEYGEAVVPYRRKPNSR